MHFFQITAATLAIIGLSKAYILDCKTTSGMGTGRPCWAFTIDQGINHLNHEGRTCVIKAGEEKRVSCSHNAGIWVRNKGKTDIVEDCSTFADAAQIITSKCLIPISTPQVRGTLYEANFDVMVGGTNC